MSDGQCQGLVGWFGLVCGPLLHVSRSVGYSVQLCCVFHLFLLYSGYRCLQSKNHQFWVMEDGIHSDITTPGLRRDVGEGSRGESSNEREQGRGWTLEAAEREGKSQAKGEVNPSLRILKGQRV